ncbi:MAG: hypothetical protein K6F26_07200 [Lachnospiraceae bacterium]|nr:hypothetical protein [Lachnospiraceae bacterium]
MDENAMEIEIQGQLLSLRYSTSSHGMMAGSGFYGSETIEWNKDGSIILASSYTGGGRSARTEYRVNPELAERVREYVDRTGLAALSKKDIPLPLVYDCFTSVSIHMEYGDINGKPWERQRYNLECGAAGMTFGEIEHTLSDLIKECRENGECIVNETKEQPNGSPFGMMGGPMTMGGMMGLGPMTMGGTAAPTPAQTETEPKELPEPEPGCWTCKYCRFNKNSGRFCAECGAAKE